MAMCVGDILFFLAIELLGSIKTDTITLGRILRLVGREFQSVGVAQMADVAKTTTTTEDILSLYTFKTARYTFALPLMLGATLAGTTKETLKYLESFGVSAGILFQIRDDMLDRESALGPKVIVAYKKAAEESIKRLAIPGKDKRLLKNLLKFVMSRNI
jgi:geranylgeranyl pyrophosphate synthase